MARTTPEAVRRAAFLDGREAFASAAETVPIPDFLGAAQHWPREPIPTILHVSFCGSTLLARSLDVSGRTIVYREPAIQIALADRLAAKGDVAPLVDAASRALGRPIERATAIVKPTNWANSLLPVWTASRAIRPVFVTLPPRDFLVAVFRGGRERIGFTLRVAQHLAAGRDDGQALVAAACALDAGSLHSAAALTLVALELQCRLFAEARAALRLDASAVIDGTTIFADPTGAAVRAAALLGLSDLTPAAMQGHAKSGGSFSPTRERDSNAAVEAGNGAAFDHALRWAEQHGLAFAA